MKKFDYRKWVTEQRQLNEGFPIQCCVNGVNTNLSVPNASDGCDSLGYTDPPCASINNPVEPNDVKDTGNNGGSNACELSFDSCAQTHDLAGNFVNNDPSAFLTRMENRYNTKGCPHLQKIRDRHQDHLNTGIYIGANHPNGTQMGPKWIAQKQSKVNFLNCILNGPCCLQDIDDGGASPDQPMGMGETMYENNKMNLKRIIKEAIKDLKSKDLGMDITRDIPMELEPGIDPVAQKYYCGCSCRTGGGTNFTHQGGTFTDNGCACSGVADYYNDLGNSGATGTDQFAGTTCQDPTPYSTTQDDMMFAPEDMM